LQNSCHLFARPLDNFIFTHNFSLISQIHDFGSGHPDNYWDLHPGQLNRSPGQLFGTLFRVKNASDGATNVYSLNRRAVMFN
jgi:hypothetical protein